MLGGDLEPRGHLAKPGRLPVPWEKVLQENLGNGFYLPAHKRDKLAGRSTAWDYVADDPKLPRVLLIGDSVSRGYTLPTRKALVRRRTTSLVVTPRFWMNK